MALSRASRTWPVLVLITPASTTVTPPGPASSTPNPVPTNPGSTPMTLRIRRSGTGLVESEGASTAPSEASPRRIAPAEPAPERGPALGRRPGSCPHDVHSDRLLGGGDGVDDLVGDVVVGEDG